MKFTIFQPKPEMLHSYILEISGQIPDTFIYFLNRKHFLYFYTVIETYVDVGEMIPKGKFFTLFEFSQTNTSVSITV